MDIWDLSLFGVEPVYVDTDFDQVPFRYSYFQDVVPYSPGVFIRFVFHVWEGLQGKSSFKD